MRSLEAAGHLARTGDPDDRRATRIAVTDSGQALLREALRRARAGSTTPSPPGRAADRAALATLLSRLAEDLA